MIHSRDRGELVAIPPFHFDLFLQLRPKTTHHTTRTLHTLSLPATNMYSSSPGRYASPPRGGASAQPALELVSDRCLSDVSVAGTFVSPDPIVAVLAMPPARRGGPPAVWTAESGGWLRVRNGVSGEVEQQRRIGGQEPTCMCYAAPARSVWVGTSEGPLVVFSEDGCARVAECLLHEAGVTCLVFVRDRLWSAGSDGRVAVWDTRTCAVERCFLACHGPVNNLAPLGAVGVAANGDDGAICVWPLERMAAAGADEAPLMRLRAAHPGGSAVLALCAVGATLWSGAEDGSLRVWAFAGDALRPAAAPAALRFHTAAVHCIAKEPSGGRVWTASLDGALALWDGDRAAFVAQLPMAFPTRGNHFVFSVAPVAAAVAQRMWACGTDGTVRSWLSVSECGSSPSLRDDFLPTFQRYTRTSISGVRCFIKRRAIIGSPWA